MSMTELDRRLQANLLTGRRVDGDRLVLGDATLLAALSGSRPLTPGERTALQASPLTARRLAVLAQARRNQAAWRGSAGMLRAADSGAPFEALTTDDGAWRLHVVAGRAILQLDPESSLAATLLRAPQPLRVLDGAGNTVLEGQLDLDGECEGPWPFDEGPARHFLRHGGGFTVEPIGT